MYDMLCIDTDRDGRRLCVRCLGVRQTKGTTQNLNTFFDTGAKIPFGYNKKESLLDSTFNSIIVERMEEKIFTKRRMCKSDSFVTVLETRTDEAHCGQCFYLYL